MTPWSTGTALPAPVAAVVVNHNAGEHLVACVRSLREEGVEELVVVDNASSDGSLEALLEVDPAVDALRTGANLGYGAGANRGLLATSAELVAIANPDVVVRPGALATLAAVLLDDETVAIAGPRLENPDGTRYPSARAFPSLLDSAGHGFLGLVAPRNRFSRRYRRPDLEPEGPVRVDWVSGAFLLARRFALGALGGFDEAYFMYAEDADLCWRAWRAGYSVVYEPRAVVTHVQGVSAGRHPYRMIVAHHRSLLRFAARTSRGRRRALLPAVAAGLALRAGLASAQHALSRVRDQGCPRLG
jgi:N-acetylglucosaminyl-diphospho-decaprenol L-rhamnosyltransferase